MTGRDPTDEAPLAVGRYAIFGRLATGGMASVHYGCLAGEAGFSRVVAVKRLHPQFVNDPDFTNMLKDEARIACRIRHPNVVPVLDVVAQADELLLVMEYVEGAALATLARKVRAAGDTIPPAVAIAMVVAMLRGLHAAHEVSDADGERLGIVHRDVSEQNVLLGGDGIVRLIDFGIAKAAGRSTVTREGQLKGKLRYMPPEQIKQGVTDRRTDIYAASVVLWQLLVGRQLFEGDEATVLYQILQADLKAPSEVAPQVPVELDDAVLRGLSRDPAMRYATAAEMAEALEVLCVPASVDEVSHFVRRHLADELEARRLRAARIERRMKDVAEVPATGTVRTERQPATADLTAAPFTTATSITRVERPRVEPQLHVAPASGPPPASRWLLLALLLAAVAMVGWRLIRTGPSAQRGAEPSSSTRAPAVPATVKLAATSAVSSHLTPPQNATSQVVATSSAALAPSLPTTPAAAGRPPSSPRPPSRVAPRPPSPAPVGGPAARQPTGAGRDLGF